MNGPNVFLVLGATGQTGRHFTSLALNHGHQVKALVRDLSKIDPATPNLEIVQGSITNPLDLDSLLEDIDFAVSLLGDPYRQKQQKINTAYIRQLVPAMRRQGVSRLLYQAGGLSAAPDQALSPMLWAIRSTVARKYLGQHKDNEAVMSYLAEEAMDIEWMVHRAAIGSDGQSKGVLERSHRKVSVATFRDCAAYNFQLLTDTTAIHTCNFSAYRT